MSAGNRDKDQLWDRVRKTVQPLKRRTSFTELGKLLNESSASSSPVEARVPEIVRSYVPEPPQQSNLLTEQLPFLDSTTSKKIAKGKLSIEGKLDLHGMTQDEAHSRLFRFVEGAHLAGKRTVLVITGKGVRGEGILRQAVPRWLALPEFRKRVIGFHEAHSSHGGSGALYLRIRRI